jgi:hypothetical protein
MNINDTSLNAPATFSQATAEDAPHRQPWSPNDQLHSAPAQNSTPPWAATPMTPPSQREGGVHLGNEPLSDAPGGRGGGQRETSETASMINSNDTDGHAQSAGMGARSDSTGPLPHAAEPPHRAGKSEVQPLRNRKRRLVEREAVVTAVPRTVFLGAPFAPSRHLDELFGPLGGVDPRHGTCGARTRKGLQCRALGLANGKCRNHGGLSTGPQTAASWERTRAGYRQWVNMQRGLRPPLKP